MKYNSRNAKIYSRFRLFNFHKHDRKVKERNLNEKNKRFRLLKVMVVITIATITALLSIQAINPIVDKLCINEAQNIATKIANNESSKIMEQYSYDDLITVVKDNDNNVSMVQANTNTINVIISKMPNEILDQFYENDNNNIYIYLGSLLGLKIFSGVGPKLTARIANTSNVQTALKSDFSDAGINQTLHRIYLEVTLQVSILTPYNVVDTQITNQILLAESIIVGKVPSSYYYLNNGTTSDSIKAIK